MSERSQASGGQNAALLVAEGPKAVVAQEWLVALPEVGESSGWPPSSARADLGRELKLLGLSPKHDIMSGILEYCLVCLSVSSKVPNGSCCLVALVICSFKQLITKKEMVFVEVPNRVGRICR